MKRPIPRPALRQVLFAFAGACGGAHAQGDDTLNVAAASALPAVTVTGTREKNLLSETAASVGVISEDAIRFTAPMHPQQLLGQIPGVAVAVTNGEGHTTAIRQPFTTSPVYLYLEDGIPIRATGFFNHNALYEVNIPIAGSVEVVRGPGTALYGSDAIGGIVNVLTKAPSSTPELCLSGELGSFGWRRLLADGSGGVSADGSVRAAGNLTHTDGWRDATAYDRQGLNLRWDQDLGGGGLKTILGVTRIDQQTGANSPLTYDDYLHNPTINNFSVAYR
jgi:iron complex outermembrane receptor protein